MFKSKNIPLLTALLILVILIAFNPSEIGDACKLVDWETIATITGLLLITNALKESGFFESVSIKFLSRVKTERNLALFLITLSSTTSMLFTNDIALFAVVPMTVAMSSRLSKGTLTKLVILEAIAVNCGSMITPMGNPQNIFIWREWNIPIFDFIAVMLPIGLISVGMVIVLSILMFEKGKKVKIEDGVKSNLNLRNTILSLSLLTGFITSVELDITKIGLAVVVIILLFTFNKALFSADLPFVAFFIVLFIDIGMITQLKWLNVFLNSLNLKHQLNLYSVSIAVSQIISNVPATILISKFSSDWKTIAYGTNIAGNGLIIGSLANIIALRFLNDKNAFIKFHAYSMPFLGVSSVIGYIILKAIS